MVASLVHLETLTQGSPCRVPGLSGVVGLAFRRKAMEQVFMVVFLSSLGVGFCEH